MTKITFYKGLNVIGGTFIKVETEKAVLMFDFGFTVMRDIDSNVRLREGHIPEDYVRIGRLPAADGIYEEAVAEKIDCIPYGKTEKPHFFIISHMHIDHMGGLDMLDPNIPVYMSKDSLRLYRKLCNQGEFTYRAHKNCIGIPYGDSFTVGDIRINVFPIDHDCTGATGFIIETPDGNIAYTGDYRFHGLHPEQTEGFGETCHDAGIDIMITEGTTASWDEFDMLTLEKPDELPRTEYNLIDEVDEILDGSSRLIIINPYERNVARVHNLYNLCLRHDRKLVLDNAQADYLSEFYPEDKIYVYSETVDGRPVPNGAELVSRDEIISDPGSFMLQIPYRNSYELLDIGGVTDAYLHMDGYPLGDYDPSYQKMQSLLEKIGIKYVKLGLGGHAIPYYLRHMIDTVSPKCLIPIHSQRPENVNAENIGFRILPTEGQTIFLDKKEIHL